MTTYRWGLPQGIGEWGAVAILVSFMYGGLQQIWRAVDEGRAYFDTLNSDLSEAGWLFVICFNLIPLLVLPAAIFNFLGHRWSSLALFGWCVGQLLIYFSRVQGFTDGFPLWLLGFVLFFLGSVGLLFFQFYRPVPPPFRLKEVTQEGQIAVWVIDLGKKSADVMLELTQISNWGIGLLNKHLRNNLPIVLIDRLSQADAENLKARLEAKGAVIEIRPTAPET